MQTPKTGYMAYIALYSNFSKILGPYLGDITQINRQKTCYKPGLTALEAFYPLF